MAGGFGFRMMGFGFPFFMCVVGIDQAWSGCGLHWRRSRRLVNETSIVNESPFHQHDSSECENEDDDDSGDDDDDFLDAGCMSSPQQISVRIWPRCFQPLLQQGVQHGSGMMIIHKRRDTRSMETIGNT
jgi:hypothetical protein